MKTMKTMRAFLALGLLSVATSAAAQNPAWTAPPIGSVKVVCRSSGSAVTSTVEIVMGSGPKAPGRRYLFAFKNAQNQTSKFAGTYTQPIHSFNLPANTYNLVVSFAPLTGTLAPVPGWAQATRTVTVPAGLVVVGPKGSACGSAGAGIGAP